MGMDPNSFSPHSTTIDPFSHSHSHSSSQHQPFSRHLSSRIGNETPNFPVTDVFTNGTHTPPINRYNIERKEYGLGLALHSSPMFPPPPPLEHDHWAHAIQNQHQQPKKIWGSSLLGSIGGGRSKSRIWLKTPKISDKRRLSDGLLSPQGGGSGSPPRNRHHTLTRTCRRKLNLFLLRLPLVSRLGSRGRELVFVLAMLFAAFYLLSSLSLLQPFLSFTSEDVHPYETSFLDRERAHLGVPLDPPPSGHLIHSSPRGGGAGGGAGTIRQAAGTVPLAPARSGDGWTWKDRREELGSLVHYITSSDLHSLPEVNPSEPLDPQLILDFNPFASYAQSSSGMSGHEQVAQMVEALWAGKGEGDTAGGQVLIVGRGRDPSVFTIRALIESLRLNARLLFVDLEGRSDALHLEPLLLRILDVPKLPALVVGGHTVGDFFAVRRSQSTGEFDRLLSEARVSYLPPPLPPKPNNKRKPKPLDDDSDEPPTSVDDAEPPAAAPRLKPGEQAVRDQLVVPHDGEHAVVFPGAVAGGGKLRMMEDGEEWEVGGGVGGYGGEEEKEEEQWEEGEEEEEEEEVEEGPLGIGIRVGFDEEEDLSF
ncbi:hypothetical protein BDY24DRAFT_198368 [Mrakia frigida]|uniref:uncharacterized protein n=1 Tax=Mrakia frigida TaxID=29902 RepID=UPI003FCBF13D